MTTRHHRPAAVAGALLACVLAGGAASAQVPWSPGPASWVDDLEPITADDWNADRPRTCWAGPGSAARPRRSPSSPAWVPSRRCGRSSTTTTPPTAISRRSSTRGSGTRACSTSRRADPPPPTSGCGTARAWGSGSSPTTSTATPSRSPTASSTGCARPCSRPAASATGGPSACSTPTGRSRRRWPSSGTGTSRRPRARSATTARCWSRSRRSSGTPPATSATSSSRWPRTRRCSTTSTPG